MIACLHSVVAAYRQVSLPTQSVLPSLSFLPLSVIASTAAVLVAFIHFRTARNSPLDEILKRLGAKPADPGDIYHSRLIDEVREAESSSGIKPIRAVVIPSKGLNCFSVQDRDGRAAIGAMEGLLLNLDRSELKAVVAHEVAHLLHGDSQLNTLACSLIYVFDRITNKASKEGIMIRSARPIIFALPMTLLLLYLSWLTLTVRYGLSILSCTIASRERDFLADAHASKMCKDPTSLAEALHKISGSYRGEREVSEKMSPLFILDFKSPELDEQKGAAADLSSTNSPIGERLRKLM